MSRWFRWYAGTTEDGKFRMVARNAKVTVATVTGVWAALLEDASHPDHRGIVTKNEDYFAAVLDLSDGEAENIFAAMQDADMISVGHGAITITHWKERQFETDTKDSTNAERQRRFREKRKETAPQTERNGSVTDAKRPDTESYTDTDTDKTLVPSVPVAARVKAKEQGLNKFTGRVKGKDDGIDKLTKRAEGLGVDVDRIVAAVEEAKPDNYSAYFTKLCVNDLQTRLPGLPEQMIRDALWKKSPQAFTAVTGALLMQEDRQ